ncbi:MAG TPA: head GIN domain-containing protein [Chitinophagaceae bacterium]|nr:head GIN domain-containing protein [Chitinophagaceae bacterium]
MKQIQSAVIFLLLSVLAISPAFSQDNDWGNKHDKNRIEGSGNMITKEYPVQSFEELEASGVFSIQLIQGGKEQVKIEADDNLMDLFEVKNDGSKLVIKMKKDSNFSSKKMMKVYVTFKSLKAMDLNMVGSLKSDDKLSFGNLKIKNGSVGSLDLHMTAQNIDLNNSSVGSVKLEGKAENAVIKNKGVGSIQAGDFIVQTMDIDNTGVGSATVNAEKECKVKDSFLGKVNNKGGATVKRSTKTVI